MSDFYFNGVAASSFGLVVEEYPAMAHAARKLDTVSVPGRNGDVLITQDAWDNVEATYKVYFNAGANGAAPERAAAIMRWLSSAADYARLEDTYNPEIFRLAICTNAMEFENFYNRFGRGEITFNCRPERFLLSGEDEITLTSGMTLTNPTGMKALPVVTVTGNGTLTIGDYSMTISGADDTAVITIDSESGLVYSGDVNMASKISNDDFYILEAGESLVTVTGFSAAAITPRWWTL